MGYGIYLLKERSVLCFKKTKEFFDKLVLEGKSPGVDCLIYQNHKPIFRYFAGIRDIENNIEINGEEKYAIFSMTKMITVVSALQLFERGYFKMNDPLYKYIPEYENMFVRTDNDESIALNGNDVSTGKELVIWDKPKEFRKAKQKILIKHLFTMASGINYDIKSDIILNSVKEGKKSTLDIVKALSKSVLTFEPGTRFLYSLSHDVLGGLVEVLSGKTLGEYMKENIFDPLGMKDTHFGNIKNESLDRFAPLYRPSANGFIRQPLENPFMLSDIYESGGAGLISTTSNYAVFLDALANGGVGLNNNRILYEKTVNLMNKNYMTGYQCHDFDELRKGYGYGLGVRVHTNPEISESLTPVGEFGWDGAAGGFSLVDRDNSLSITVFQSMFDWDVKIQTELKNSVYLDLFGKKTMFYT